ncbi:hypothetical protein NC652_012795 [Populus alba x Populus x berolinensis]|nr:hypothetical protein NC652_012795 [Populus alba x Populus x berolinensis]
MGTARLRIQRMATSLFSREYDGRPLKEVRLCIPGSEVPEWFSYKNREGSSVKVRQAAHWHHRLTSCAVVSFGQSGERLPCLGGALRLFSRRRLAAFTYRSTTIDSRSQGSNQRLEANIGDSVSAGAGGDCVLIATGLGEEETVGFLFGKRVIVEKGVCVIHPL